jgi:hypothetical protein
MKDLTKEQLKKIMGGIYPPPSACSVTCDDGLTIERNCGPGSTCDTSGTYVTCNDETSGVDVCAGTVPCN